MTHIETPCVRICRQDKDLGFCTGCGRTIEEVFEWHDLDAGRRKTLMEELPMRLQTAGLPRKEP
ncbi:DUF1289 domain-containing protein [Mesorhizobium sp. CGMCC 1.15528]|uniref:DUF1289 domain-containing protein n=1 Tax=Mesorhizobium zhangyense TaxID=1776730 RepID=A0A7C9RB98_9HYPH|nr:DUF1289 domain-containing protein [Mesorhizobium zhangyense]